MCGNPRATLTQPTDHAEGGAGCFISAPISHPNMIHRGDFVSYAGRKCEPPYLQRRKTILNVSTDTRITHPQVISILSRLRQEWQEATAGTSLPESDGIIGLMLADLINGFRLNLDEQHQILGDELFQELKIFAPSEA